MVQITHLYLNTEEYAFVRIWKKTPRSLKHIVQKICACPKQPGTLLLKRNSFAKEVNTLKAL